MKREVIFGWLAIGLATLISVLWTSWGVIENFHEGWYYPSFWQNIALMLIQYLSLAIIFTGFSLVGIVKPKIGGVLYFVAGLVFNFLIFFSGAGRTLGEIISWMPATLPLLLIGLFFWFGQVSSRRKALTVAVGLPFLVGAVFAVEPAIRVAGRIDDGIRDARVVYGNGVTFVWAPVGPGWPERGVNWHEAKRRCQFLTEDGLSLADSPQDIWRLPTMDEAVRSMVRHGENAGGVWDAEAQKASYAVKPDKESPLWDTHSMIIYWWTADEKDSEYAYLIAYDGQRWTRLKNNAAGYHGYRCIKNYTEPEF